MDRPYADVADVSLMVTRRWVFETKYPMRYILTPGFFDKVWGLRQHDRIDVISFGDTPVSHSLLVVEDIREDQLDKIRVSMLFDYKRKVRP